jgi:hypothetical protein
MLAEDRAGNGGARDPDPSAVKASSDRQGSMAAGLHFGKVQ